MSYTVSPEELHKAIHLVIPKEDISNLIGGPLATAVGLAFQTLPRIGRGMDTTEDDAWKWETITAGILLYKAGWLDGQTFNSL